VAKQPISLVLAGGVGLGAYQGGAYEALAQRCEISWVAGSSAGAINAALIAGSAPSARLDALRGYWLAQAMPNAMALVAGTGAFRHMANWMSALQARLLGSPRHLRPAGPQLSFSRFYDLAPTASYLERTIDLGRLNGGEPRLAIATTDIESGDLVCFDTGRGDRIGIDHLLASCGFLPEFAPVEIGGRLLGDGGLAANAPVEPVLDEAEGRDDAIVVVDLYARDGSRPDGLEAALARKTALIFGNQTFRRLDIYRRLWQRLLPPDAARPSILYLSYQPAPEEAGPEMPFDLSQQSARDRWRAGLLDGREALGHLDRSAESAMLTVIRR